MTRLRRIRPRLPRSTPLSTVEAVSVPEPDEPAPAAPARLPRRRRLASWLSPTSTAPVYLGIVLVLAGFGLLAYTWSRVAGTAIVPLQLPYIASGGFTGIGLVIVGVLAIYLGTKRRDSWHRDRRMAELASTLTAIGPADEPGLDEASG